MRMFKIFLLSLSTLCVLSGAELKTVILKGGAEPGKNEEAKVLLAPGQRVELRLDSNPTTGYDWEFLLSISGTLEVVKNEFLPSNKPLCGAGGVRVLTLKAVKKGNGKLLGFYRRCWEKFDPAKDQRYLLTFVVKEK